MAKAILLLSGGLDSTLAGKLIIEQGIEVEAINFVSPFCRCTPKGLTCPASRLSAQMLGIRVKVFACDQNYLEAIKNPKYGRGKGMNACIDCRIYMFRRAKEYMEQVGADFIVTGEVLGERPMSQHYKAMMTIEREAGLEGLVVRPLSAKLLKPSIPEEKGIIDREALLDISGRCRRPQFELAEKLNIKDYLCPAGGCLLTDREFSARFKDLLIHKPDFNLSDANLLKYGRHFRLTSGAKVVVGRDEKENKIIERYFREGDALIVPLDIPGPTTLCKHYSNEEDIYISARLTLTYTKAEGPSSVLVREANSVEEERVIKDVEKFDRQTAEQWRVSVNYFKKRRGN